MLYAGSRASRKYLIMHFALLNRETNPIILAIKREKVMVSSFVSNVQFSSHSKGDEVTYIERVKTTDKDLIVCGTFMNGIYFFDTKTGELYRKISVILNSQCSYFDPRNNLLYVQDSYAIQAVDTGTLRRIGDLFTSGIDMNGIKILPSRSNSNKYYVLHKEARISQINTAAEIIVNDALGHLDADEPLFIFDGVVISCFDIECLTLACNVGLVLWNPLQMRYLDAGNVHAVDRLSEDGSIVVYSCIKQEFAGIVVKDIEKDSILKKIEFTIHSVLNFKVLTSYPSILLIQNADGTHVFDLDRDEPKGMLICHNWLETKRNQGIVEILEKSDKGQNQLRIILLKEDLLTSQQSSLLQVIFPL
ncbi:hypothetical protein FGO68_gene3262 [Halteria grandinella]|uniref:Uncharacterized protein n=1 Tax=Halteria grandinella TaxID=5974 RepID=A0A8J8NLY0_HALGN|nr:hypothetical protein FGO68_gene3262 [Halteria grandinella]